EGEVAANGCVHTDRQRAKGLDLATQSRARCGDPVYRGDLQPTSTINDLGQTTRVHERQIGGVDVNWVAVADALAGLKCDIRGLKICDFGRRSVDDFAA